MKILITIDVEAHRGKNPLESFVWGKASDGKYHGLEQIVAELEKRNIIAVFFLDFSEFYDYDEGEMSKIIDYLKSHNQYIGIHLHPDHFGDHKRTFMWEYDYEEQNKMIYYCVNKYNKYINYSPIFFRAGKFGANDNTIRALMLNGIHYDFSGYYNHRWCRLSKQFSSNRPYKISDNVIEIPVSIFRSLCLGNKKSYRYDQFDLGICPNEFSFALEDQKKIGSDEILTVFFHSFSMFMDRRNPESLKYNRVIFEYFTKNLDTLLVSGIEIINPFKNKWNESIVHEEGLYLLPYSGNIFKQLYYIYKRAVSIKCTNLKAKVLVWAVRLGILMIIGFAFNITLNLWR